MKKLLIIFTSLFLPIYLNGCGVGNNAKLIEWKFSDTAFVIPRDYFALIPEEQSPSSALLELFWPDFRPKVIPGIFKNDADFNKGRMTISISSVRKKLTSALEQYIPSTIRYENNVKKYYEEIGLENLIYIGTHTLDYFRTLDGRYLMQCSSALTNEKLSRGVCSVHFNYEDSDLVLQVLYSRKFISQTPDIIRRTNFFLKHHEVSTKEEATSL